MQCGRALTGAQTKNAPESGALPKVHDTVRLQWLNIRSAGSFIPLFNIETNSLPFVKSFEPGSIDGTVMHKYISALIVLDKTKPLFLVEPLYFSLCQSLNPPFKILFFPE